MALLYSVTDESVPKPKSEEEELTKQAANITELPAAIARRNEAKRETEEEVEIENEIAHIAGNRIMQALLGKLEQPNFGSLRRRRKHKVHP